MLVQVQEIEEDLDVSDETRPLPCAKSNQSSPCTTFLPCAPILQPTPKIISTRNGSPNALPWLHICEINCIQYICTYRRMYLPRYLASHVQYSKSARIPSCLSCLGFPFPRAAIPWDQLSNQVIKTHQHASPSLDRVDGRMCSCKRLRIVPFFFFFFFF